MLTEIVYEDKDVLVVRKPAGLATQTARVGQQDVVSELKNYLRHFAGAGGGSGKSGGGEKREGSGKSEGGEKCEGSRKSEGGEKCGRSGKCGGSGKSERRGKGEPYLGILHRLDQPVEGLLVFARNRDAARCLSGQLQDQGEEGSLSKHYLAVLCGVPVLREGRLTDILCKESVVVGTHKEYISVVKTPFQGPDVPVGDVRFGAALPARDLAIGPQAALPAKDSAISAQAALPARDSAISAQAALPAKDSAISAQAALPAKDSAIGPQSGLPARDLAIAPQSGLPAKNSAIGPQSALPVRDSSIGIRSADIASTDAFAVPVRPGGQPSLGERAELEYRIVQVHEAEGLSLADIRLVTGRFHQIRAQMAHAGTPLLGDLKYGNEGSKALAGRLGIRYVALCACSLEFRHPTSGKRMEFRIEPKNPAFSFFSQL